MPKLENRNSKSENRKSKVENRLMVIPAQAGVHNRVEPRFRGGDVARSEFRFSSFRVILTPDFCLLTSVF